MNVYKNPTCFNRWSVRYDFQLTSPRMAKLRGKERDFVKHGILGKIVLNNNFELVDGYCSYLICKKHNMNKIPVYFES